MAGRLLPRTEWSSRISEPAELVLSWRSGDAIVQSTAIRTRRPSETFRAAGGTVVCWDTDFVLVVALPRRARSVSRRRFHSGTCIQADR